MVSLMGATSDKSQQIHFEHYEFFTHLILQRRGNVKK